VTLSPQNLSILIPAIVAVVVGAFLILASLYVAHSRFQLQLIPSHRIFVSFVSISRDGRPQIDSQAIPYCFINNALRSLAVLRSGGPNLRRISAA
jgi:hypothetical protein